MRGVELPAAAEPGRGMGFSDWQRAAQACNNPSLVRFINTLDPSMTSGNSHRTTAERIRQLGLPTQAHISPTIKQFLEAPDALLATIPDGDFYFVSIIPGTHLAHGFGPESVTAFVSQYAAAHPDELDRELYIGHSGEPVMSGHIIVSAGEPPNPITAEFTIGNFNAFHRGTHTPELSVHRNRHRFAWQFHGVLHPHRAGDWHNDARFACNGGVALTRTQMAHCAFHAITLLPRDEDYYLPGYYEVLIEKSGVGTRPVFIEAAL